VAAARLGMTQDTVAEIFGGAPIDFPITFSHHLPLLADRFGMIGITLGARVWLLDRTRSFAPEAIIVLIRHEAEHVRQQRERPAGFYLEYGLGYLRGLIGAGGRSRDAYRGIRAEREAYAAGDRARRIIAEHTGGSA
jgi:hypothetical protein